MQARARYRRLSGQAFAHSPLVGALGGCLLLSVVLTAALPRTPPSAAPRLLFGHTAWVNGVAFSPDGRWLATGSDDGSALLHDLRGGQPPRQLGGHSAAVDPVTFAPDGRLVATAGHDGLVQLWELPAGRLRARLATAGEPLYAVTFSPDSRLLATAGQTGDLALWRTADGRLETVLPAPADEAPAALWQVAWSPRGDLLAAASAAGRVILATVHSLPEGATALQMVGRPLASLTGGVNDLRFRPDGRRLATASDDGYVRVWDTASGALTATLAATPPQLVLRYSPDGRTLAAAGEDGIIRLWDARTLALRARLTGHVGWVETLAFSPDSRLLASAGEDHTARLWGVRDGRPGLVRRLAAPTDPNDWLEADVLAFSPDGRTLAAAGSPLVARLFPVR